MVAATSGPHNAYIQLQVDARNGGGISGASGSRTWTTQRGLYGGSIGLRTAATSNEIGDRLGPEEEELGWLGSSAGDEGLGGEGEELLGEQRRIVFKNIKYL